MRPEGTHMVTNVLMGAQHACLPEISREGEREKERERQSLERENNALASQQV